MIYLHVERLNNILGENRQRLNAVLRQQIRQYRNQYLVKFCQKFSQEEPIFAQLENGKPYCSNLPFLQFNHSHSQQYYALVYNQDNISVGVDIEDLDRQVRFDALAKHSFHSLEYEFWKDNGCNTYDWFAIWTIKEAILKANGLGIRMNLKELNTQFCGKADGWVEHSNLGKYGYHLVNTDKSLICVAYVWQGRALDIQWVNQQNFMHEDDK